MARSRRPEDEENGVDDDARARARRLGAVDRPSWTVVGRLAFVGGLAIECVPLILGKVLSSRAELGALALYMLWIASPFLSGKWRRLREQNEARAKAAPPWGRGVIFLLTLLVAAPVILSLDYLHKDLGVPFGAIFLALGLLGWLIRLFALWLGDKYGRPVEVDAEKVVASPGRAPGTQRPTWSRKWKMVIGVAFVALVVLYVAVIRPRAPKLEGEEAETAIAELQTLQEDADQLRFRLYRQILEMKRSGGADPRTLEDLEERTKLASVASGTAGIWKLHLEQGQVRVRQRDELRLAIEQMRKELKRAQMGEAAEER